MSEQYNLRPAKEGYVVTRWGDLKGSASTKKLDVCPASSSLPDVSEGPREVTEVQTRDFRGVRRPGKSCEKRR